MKYSWQNFTRPYQIKIWLFLVVFVTSLFSVTALSVRPAKAAELQAKWIDRITIVIGTTRYVDGDPWDGVDAWGGNNHDNNGCNDIIKINNIVDDGKSGTIDYRKVASNGTCIVDDGKPSDTVKLTNEGSRFVSAYQTDANHIFLPVYPTVEGQSALGNATVKLNGKFERQDNGITICQEDGNISQDDGIDKGKCVIFARIVDGKADIVGEPSGVWVNSSIKKVGWNNCAGPLQCSDKYKDLVFANNREFTVPPAEAQYVTTGISSETDPNNAEATPTCESNNPGIVIGWLICSVISAMDSVVDLAGNVIENLLATNTDTLTSGTSGDNLRSVWSLFRAVASFALIGVALVMIIGQAIGGDS